METDPACGWVGVGGRVEVDWWLDVLSIVIACGWCLVKCFRGGTRKVVIS